MRIEGLEGVWDRWLGWGVRDYIKGGEGVGF